MEASTAVATNSNEEKKHRRVVLLTDSAAQLPMLAQALREFAAGEVREVLVWLQVERFRAPSSTHPPYRGLARIEARNITAERAAAIETEARESMPTWAAGWQTSIEAVLDASAVSIAVQLQAEEIDLVVTLGHAGRNRELGADAAAIAGRPLLLVPESGPDASQAASDKGRRLSGRLGASQG